MKIGNIIILICLVYFFMGCKNSSGKAVSQINYDGFIAPESLSPNHFRGKYYFILNVHVGEKKELSLNNEKIGLDVLLEKINSKWKIIEQDNYKAYLTISLGNSQNAEYEYYLKVNNLLNNFRINKKEEYSKKIFGNRYIDLSKENKNKVDQVILINIVEALVN